MPHCDGFRLPVPLFRLSVPLFRLSVPLFRLSVPLLSYTGTEAPITRTVFPIICTVIPITRTVTPIIRTVTPITRTVIPIIRTVTPIIRTAIPMIRIVTLLHRHRSSDYAFGSTRRCCEVLWAMQRCQPTPGYSRYSPLPGCNSPDGPTSHRRIGGSSTSPRASRMSSPRRTRACVNRACARGVRALAHFCV